MRWLRHADDRKPDPFSQALEILGRGLVADRRGGARISPVFRALAAVLGPLMIVSGSAMSALSIYMLFAEGWGTWLELYSMFALSALSVPFGFLLLLVARRGRDPLTPAGRPRN